ncbi:MAG: TonB-dependent receptor [Acidobacteria bacterium]|nr:TonB-dependent receptor [Acidobacteriota bacterium]
MRGFEAYSRKLCWLLGLLLLCPMAVLAQQSGIVGTVTDSSGALLTGVVVTAKNVNTGETRQANSNEVGQYAIPNLKIGTYEVSAEKQGFQRKIVDQVALEVALTRTIDLSLPPGTISEQVNVTAAATALQTNESSVSTLLETKVVNEIPLNGRNFLQLQLLSPGVTLARGGTFSVVKIDAQSTSIGGGNVSVNGMRDVYNDYLLDGVSFKDWIHGTNGFNPSVDAIDEFRVQTSNYTAEFGANAGGISNLVSKSGTNQLHGSLYEFIRNDKFDALNFFTRKVGGSKLPLRRNQFGATLGGPIVRDKTFFFGSYEGFREQRTTTQFMTYPSAAMRHGDFSELLDQDDPIIIHDPATGDPYPGNVIPEDQILSVMPGYLDTYIPLPQTAGLLNNYVVPGTRRNSTNQYIGKVDHAFSDSLHLSGRYADNKTFNASPIRNPNFFGTDNNRNQNLSVQLTKTLNPHTIVEGRFGINAFKQFVEQNLAGTTPNIAADVLEINGVSVDPAASNAPSFITPGFSGLGGAPSTPRSWFSKRFEYQGSASLVRGSHMIRFGMNLVRHHETFPEIIIPNGLYVFDGTFTGYSLADMLLGIPANMLLSPELFDPQFRQTEWMPWIQDDWRVTRKLTLNLGLRYERRPWPISANNTIANILLPPGGGQATEILSAACVPDPPVRRCETSLPTAIAKSRSTMGGTDNNNFAPRVGFAYRVDNAGKTVVRGGYGVFFQPEPFNQFVFLSINPPFVSFYNRFLNQSNYQDWDWHNPTAGLPAGGIQFTYIPQNLATPYLQAWNFGIQRDLGAGVVLDVTYVGNKDSKLWARTWPNQPRPGPGDIDSRRPYTNVSTIAGNEPIGNANYHGLQAKAERRFSKGLSLLAGYTWSKAITDSQAAETGAFVPDLQDNYNRRANRGLWSADARHRFTLSGIYDLPIGSRQALLGNVQGVAGKIISGWQLGTIVTLQSGQPQTAVLAFDNPNVGEGAKLPNMLRNPNNGPKTADQWFDIDAFEVPEQYTFGNESIGAVTGPGIANVDFSLAKNTALTERINLQFRAEAFNLFNHTILGDPDMTFGSPSFATITSTRLENREMQFSLRLVF